MDKLDVDQNVISIESNDENLTNEDGHDDDIYDKDSLHGYYVPPLPGTGLDKCNVFIKFLPIEVTDTGLYAMFSKFGEITSYKVMVDPITGSSLGYGFCRYKTSEEATKAIENMSGTVIGNKTLLCKLSHGISRNNSLPNNNLYIKPLLPTTSEGDLLEIFSKYGKIVDCKVMLDRNTGLSRQIGFVRFENVEDATKALTATNGLELDKDFPPIVVKYAENESHKINRKAKRFANQSADAARKVANQFKMQKSRMYNMPPMYNDFNYVNPYQEQDAPESIPYVVKDQFGNVTFAPSTPPEMFIPDMNIYNMYPYDMGYDQTFTPYYIPDVYYRPTYYTKKHKYYKNKYIPNGHQYNNGAYKNNRKAFSNDHNDGQQYNNRENVNGHRNGYHNNGFKNGHHNNGYKNGHHNGDRPKKSIPWVEPNLFIFHLPPSIDDLKLKKMFEIFGALEHVNVVKDKNTNQSKGYGFVKYYNMADAIKAIKNMNGLSIENKNLRVTFKSDDISKSDLPHYDSEESEDSASDKMISDESDDEGQQLAQSMENLSIEVDQE